ncbi:hypothetical protein, partial [Bacteroides thetaiotaomicron]|uniref:hypothetical protein n=1 Tax=Bacteroides thetaiotaomicron TaxID=818 RepID=UPI000B01FBA2
WVFPSKKGITEFKYFPLFLGGSPRPKGKTFVLYPGGQGFFWGGPRKKKKGFFSPKKKTGPRGGFLAPPLPLKKSFGGWGGGNRENFPFPKVLKSKEGPFFFQLERGKYGFRGKKLFGLKNFSGGQGKPKFLSGEA